MQQSKEYWVNVYEGVPPYNCHKFETEIDAVQGIPTYDYPMYRIHVKMKEPKYSLKRRVINSLNKFDWMT